MGSLKRTKKSKQSCEVISFEAKQHLKKEKTPREKLLQNQRKLFNVEAKVYQFMNKAV